MQEQSDVSSLPGRELELIVQQTHAVLPWTCLYLPTTFVVHVPPWMPENPELQRQSANSLETDKFEYVRQKLHVVAPQSRGVNTGSCLDKIVSGTSGIVT